MIFSFGEIFCDTQDKQIILLEVNFLRPYEANISFLYPLKTSENQRFSDAFREYKNETLASNRLMIKNGKQIVTCKIP